MISLNDGALRNRRNEDIHSKERQTERKAPNNGAVRAENP
jgi:hypothetical protein